MLINGSFGKVTETFHGVPVLQWVLPKLLDAVLKAPERRACGVDAHSVGRRVEVGAALGARSTRIASTQTT